MEEAQKLLQIATRKIHKCIHGILRVLASISFDLTKTIN